MGLRHRGQRDPGETMERPSGMRVMQTFRKLPITMPKRKKKSGITVSTVPYEGRRLNAGEDGACRMANDWMPFSGLVRGNQRERAVWGGGKVSAKLDVYGDEQV